MDCNYSALLAADISKFIKILRYVYKNLNRQIYDSLGKAFQKSVSNLVRMIPSDWIKGCYNCFQMLKGIASCIDFPKMSKVLHSNCTTAWGHVNSKEFVLDTMRGYCTVSVDYEKVAEQILENFNPIFNAIDFIFGHEIEFIDRIAEITIALTSEDPLKIN